MIEYLHAENVYEYSAVLLRLPLKIYIYIYIYIYKKKKKPCNFSIRGQHLNAVWLNLPRVLLNLIKHTSSCAQATFL